jgi:hypothetical protein
VEHTETVYTWSRNRRLHLVSPKGLLEAGDLAAVERVIHRHDDLDLAADAVARVVGHPVRVRPWTPPTSDFFLDVEAWLG